ncbi:MAG TPA: cupin [Geobacteraceae bacterium]|nr:cupin [Geobacteraceae bacterium]
MSDTASGNILAALPPAGREEHFQEILQRPGVRIERIVSSGHSTPPGEWYDQEWEEWVLLMAGSAGLLVEGETEPRCLMPGDYLYLPARCRHRVEWTEVQTVWLAVHFTVSQG